MTQQSILDLVVNWEVFTINICCFIAKFYFESPPSLVLVIN